MSARTTSLLVALAACGRIGFGDAGESGSDGGDGGGGVDGQMASCPTTRTPIPSGASHLISGPSGTGAVTLWREADGTVGGGLIDANRQLTVFPSTLPGTWSRPVGIEPIASGYAVVVDDGTTEQLFSTDATLSNAVMRGSGAPGITHDPLATFGAYVMWAHVNVGTTTTLLVDRLDPAGVPTSHSNRTTPAPMISLSIDNAYGDHAHLVWGQSDGMCTAGEIFGPPVGIVSIPVATDCYEPRGATGIGDSIATAYQTAAGELHLYVDSPTTADLPLWPGGTQPTVGDDKMSTIWVAWLEATTEPRSIMFAQIAADRTVTIRRLEGVVPADATGFVLLREFAAAEPTLVVIEDGALAVVQACL